MLCVIARDAGATETALVRQIAQKSMVLNVVAGIGILLYLMHMEINFNYEKYWIETETTGAYLFHFLISINTAVLVCCLFDSYQLDVFLYRKFEAASSEEVHAFWWPSSFIYNFFTELCICVIHPIPLIIPNKMGVIMLLRTYLLTRLVRDHSELWKKRGIVARSGYRDRGGPPIDTVLCCKVQLEKNRGSILGAVSLFAVMVFSYATFIIQRETGGEVISFFHCIWGTVFLMFRGIARFEAFDQAGRMVELFTITIGVLVMAFWVALITISMDVKAEESFAVTYLYTQEKKEKRQVMGAELIQAAYRWRKLQRESPDEATIEVQIYFEDLIAKHKKFRLDCEMTDKLSLDPSVDKLLDAERKLGIAVEELASMKTAQEAMLDVFDELDTL